MECPECKGKGKLECDDQSEWVNATQYYICPLCNGTGECPKYCPTCHKEIHVDNLENLQDKLQKIINWVDAYPLDIFPEPDFKKAARVLKQNGMTLDSISASNMRHVLKGIKDIIDT